jgi:anti-sigma B factor antagonist
MSLDIHTSEREGIVVLTLKGRITVGESTVLREMVTEQLTAAKINMILNLGAVEYIDSTGLGSMVICFTSAKKAGGAMKLFALNKRNVELLALTRLHTIFEVFAEEQDAINSFFPNREIKPFDILAFVKAHQQED